MSQKNETVGHRTEREVSRLLRHDLSDEELVAAARAAGTAAAEVARLKEELKEVRGQLNGRIQEAEARMLLESQKIINRYELRHVTCRVIYDYGTERVEMTRIDTGEVVEERRMSDEELSELPI